MFDTGIMNLSWQGALVLNFGAIGYGLYRVGVYVGHVKTVENNFDSKFTNHETRICDLEKVSVTVEITRILLEMQKLRADLIDLMSQGRHTMRNEMQIVIGKSEQDLEERMDLLRIDTDRQIADLKEKLKEAADRFHTYIMMQNPE